MVPKSILTQDGSRHEPSFALLHIPHSSTFIPLDLRRTFLLSEDELRTELMLMTDHYTDELFRCDPEVAQTFIYPVSRLVVDPERFPDDVAEPMSNMGMGVIYTRTSDGRDLRTTPSDRERKDLLERFYYPHHSAMEHATRAALSHWGACLIIDCHSFPSVPLPCDLDKLLERPDICRD